MEKKTIQQVNRDKRALMDDFKVKRDGEGNLIPIEQPTKFGTVLVLPMTYGDAEAWGQKAKRVETISADEVAEQLNKHVVDPDMSKVTGPELRKDYKAMAVNELIMAILGASGLEEEMAVTVNPDGTAKIEAKN